MARTTDSQGKALPSVPTSRRRRPQNSKPAATSATRTRQEASPSFLKLLRRFENSTTWQWGRLVVVWVLLTSSALGLGWNLYRLQGIESEQFVKKARQQQMVYMRPFVPRRPIVDRNGNILATDRLVYTLYAHPKLFKQSKAEMAQKLSQILGNQSPEELLEKFEQRSTGIPIAHALREEVADKIVALSADGLELIRQYSRLYPQQELAADTIGYTDLEHHGQAGLEYSQQKRLERNVVTLRLNRAGNGALMPDHMPEGFLNFDDYRLQTSLDLRLQRAARFVLKQKLAEYEAKRGAVIVMNADDGSILALACEPTYDPNQYYKYDIGLFRNWAIADSYEPGSTFKPINIALALDAGVVQPNSQVEDTGIIRIEQWEIKNHDYDTRGARGTLSLAEVLQYSSNVGMVDIMRRLPRDRYYKALESLRIDQLMGIDLPGEAAGQLKSEQQFESSFVEAATTAFGQGFALTPLKLVQLHATIANGGKLVTPHLVKGLVDAEGKYQWQPQLPPPRPVFAPEHAEAVFDMMVNTVNSSSGEKARIDGYRIGGKSGTAQKASPTGGYYNDLRISSFVSLLVAPNHHYVVMAVVDEPKGQNAYGSAVAAPIVKSVMETLITIEEIPPN
ncbi:MAG: penicillin-binding protein 2 [Jaaginema sp. PMC 1079.18]|nr:penicillin-binding protein 2 [Jaaginema sp. PMC 1080.18]MEC4854004.1 penicillin-binding protein 2 [Jaaginema sp. PMC 1079.18]MEC4869169.1 penicillin-binding protein 2 [Jaaginema sp. PMC 1078.18]